ncbi:Curli production assembly/transport component CsgG [Desulfonatronum thiosulfatophilum]|uniref:Curli production assembly/transport component CsgG n=1 Tax=Desulfonatronum thiosulfatophilum TaxID=617002 RepID=A0A1G6B8T4_9BACT|nr:FG-GAP-like repeat-containing protein [Desulfonatronum thiosulfatophilum]SDB17058.1 Curli production assembly/transport component CsgG [Desulfonatronum thiosulfatophilum]
MRYLFRFMIVAFIFFSSATFAWSQAAAETDETLKRFAVLPFAVHGPDQYAYLGQGVQTMLTSRLKWTDRFEDLDRSTIAQVVASIPRSQEEALSAHAALGVDYLIFGSVTILGDQASLDAHVVDAQGRDTPQSAQVALNDLIPALEGMAREINAQVFGRPQAQTPQQAQAASPAGPVHPDLIYNEYGPERTPYHLNPDILYSGAADSPGRWRSQALPFASLGVVVGDADGNGRNEIFMLTDNKVLAYHAVDNRLMPLGEYAAPLRLQCLNINLMDINGDGFKEIIVSAIMDETPRSFILNFIDGKFVLAEDRIPLYLNVVRIPPDYRPTLIGQRKGRTRLFDSGVHEILRMNGQLDLSRALNLPQGTNVFNFAFLPQDDDFKVVVADNKDKLRVFSSNNTFQSVTEEPYAGSSLGLEVDESFPGIRQDLDGDMMSYYYIPSRLVPVKLGQGASWNLLVNRNISLSAQFFARYRYFPQGEIHALFWDGINMNINWKTRRIRGTVVDYGLADVMNDGRTELFVLVNTHPGATGFTQRRTVLLSYTLDMDAEMEEGFTLDMGLN